MQLQVNGERVQRAAECTVAELLEELGCEPRRVAVEVNGELVPREQHDRVQLRDADRIEIVSLVGGG